LRPDLRVLANPIKIDGRRLEQQAGPAVGADNQALLDTGAAPDVRDSAVIAD